MTQLEPPPLATWILEHCTAGEAEEALAGDLLETYWAGRSDGWYWRQVFAACAVSWTESLRIRAPLLIFTLMWSILAPAWRVFIDGIESAGMSAPMFDRIFLPLGGFWIVPAFAGWLVLNSTFLWAGILVYTFALSSCGKVFHGKKIGHAFLLAPLVFAPVFGAWFALCMLDWTMPFEHQTLATTPLGQIADLRMLADVMRLPYFITLVCVLWNAIPHSKHKFQLLPVDSLPIESSTQSDALKLVSTLDPYTVKRFFGFMVAAGLLNSLIAAFLFLHLPADPHPTLTSLVIRATIFVLIGALAGTIGVWFYWRRSSSPFSGNPPITLALFALSGAVCWLWVPAFVLLSREDSPLTGPIAILAAALLATSLRAAIPSTTVLHPSAPTPAPEDNELFAATLRRSRREAYGYIAALAIYLAAYDFFQGWIIDGSTMLAVCAFIFAWKLTLEPPQKPDRRQQTFRAARRLAWALVPAILITLFALLYGVEHRNRVESDAAVALANGSSQGGDAEQKSEAAPQDAPSTIAGYQSLILWPDPAPKRIAPPLPVQSTLLAPGTTKPLIIKFDGPYWYFQPPHKAPSPTAFQAHGTPLAHDIQSNNFIPLTMEAHQAIGAPIPLARCREIQLGILNSDNRTGVINIAVLLTDSASPANQLYLGQQPVLSSQPEHFSQKSSPAGETLRFPISLPAKIRKFDEITVMFLPDDTNYDQGPKAAIEQFQLIPR